jgi:hypothetical protein
VGGYQGRSHALACFLLLFSPDLLHSAAPRRQEHKQRAVQALSPQNGLEEARDLDPATANMSFESPRGRSSGESKSETLKPLETLIGFREL